MKNSSFISLVIILTLGFSFATLGSPLLAQENETSNAVPISGTWKGWGSMTITNKNGVIEGSYTDTYGNVLGNIQLRRVDGVWTGRWGEKPINRDGNLFNIEISEDGKTISGLYSVINPGSNSNGNEYPRKENVPFQWTLVMSDDEFDPDAENDTTTDEDVETTQQPCAESHTVNIKSTLWIADMDLEEEIIEYKAYLLRNNVPIKEHARRIGVYTGFIVGTNEFPDDGFYAEPADPTKRKFRIASDLDINVAVEDGKLVRAEANGQPNTRGGYEGAGLYGSSNARVLNQLMTPEKYTCRIVVYGDPHWLAQITLNGVEFRTSTRIWHYVEVEITPRPNCTIETRARFRASSAFPSHRLWIDNAEVGYGSNPANAHQGHAIQLYEATKIDIEIAGRKTDLPPLDFASLLRFMGTNANKWVRPRFNPESLLSWPE